MIYSTLAAYYDQLVGDEEAVEHWVEWIESFAPGSEFLELACGSGSITRKLCENHRVTAMDLSNAMVEEARKKDPSGLIEFSSGDMRDLSEYGLFDAIGCFCDSFNYILSLDQVQKFFEETAAHLKEGGLFFFDTHSLDRLEEFSEEYEEAGEFQDGTGLQWVIAAEDDFLFQDFAFYFPDATIQEHHMQRVYDPDVLMEALDPYYDILSVRTDFDKDGITNGEKYFFVCRKKQHAENRSE